MYNKMDIKTAVTTPSGAVVSVDGGMLDNTAFLAIKKQAEKLGQTINNPNPKCKSCYGRGYIGRLANSKAPIPCKCIHTKEDLKRGEYYDTKLRKLSRSERRKSNKG